MKFISRNRLCAPVALVGTSSACNHVDGEIAMRCFPCLSRYGCKIGKISWWLRKRVQSGFFASRRVLYTVFPLLVVAAPARPISPTACSARSKGRTELPPASLPPLREHIVNSVTEKSSGLIGRVGAMRNHRNMLLVCRLRQCPRPLPACGSGTSWKEN